MSEVLSDLRFWGSTIAWSIALFLAGASCFCFGFTRGANYGMACLSREFDRLMEEREEKDVEPEPSQLPEPSEVSDE